MVDPHIHQEKKHIVIAWQSGEDDKNLVNLQVELTRWGAAVEIVHNMTKLLSFLDECESKKKTPYALIPHIHFGRVPVRGLNQIFWDRIREWNPDVRPLSIAITPKLLGADLKQFAIDAKASKMVMLNDLPHAVIDSLDKLRDRKTSEPELPIIHTQVSDPILLTELAKQFTEVGQQIKPVDLSTIDPLGGVEGGVLLVEENTLERIDDWAEEVHRLRDSPPPQTLKGISDPGERTIEKLSVNTGVVVLIENRDSASDLLEEQIKWFSRGALGCVILKGSTEDPATIVNECLSVRRNRTRKSLNDEQVAASLAHVVKDKLEDTEESPIASILHDEQGKIYAVSESTLKIFGYSRDEMKSMDVKSLHPANMWKERMRNYESFDLSGVLKAEMIFEKKNKKRFEAKISARRIMHPFYGKLIKADIQSLEVFKFIEQSVVSMISSKSKDLSKTVQAVLEKMGSLIEEISSVHVIHEDSGHFRRKECWLKDPARDPCGDLQIHESKVQSAKACAEAGIKFIEDARQVSESQVTDSYEAIAAKEIKNLFPSVGDFDFIAGPMKLGEQLEGFVVVIFEGDRKPGAEEGSTNYLRQKVRRPLELISSMIASCYQREREEIIRKKMEAQSIHEDKKRSISHVTEGVAHDFNNVLQTITSHVSRLLDSEAIREDQKSSLRSVKSAAEFGASLSSRMRDVSKSVNGASFSLHDLIQDVARLIRPSLALGVSVNFDRLNASADSVRCDRSEVHQVLMNLLTNANNAMEESSSEGEIVISSGVISRDQGGRFIRVIVEDGGMGIPKDNLLKIFEPYFSSKVNTKQGTGLGLWIVSRLMRNHGGKVTVENGDIGAKFILEWPLIEDEPILEVEHTRKQGTGCILFVDDDELVNESCRELVGHLGYEVLWALDGFRALEIFEEHRKTIDLVILDQKMPRMSGNECLEKLVKMDPSVKVIMSSGNYTTETDETSAKNVLGILPKPYSLAALESEINNALESVVRRDH